MRVLRNCNTTEKRRRKNQCDFYLLRMVLEMSEKMYKVIVRRGRVVVKYMSEGCVNRLQRDDDR